MAKYIHRFRNGAWGDHISVQSISNVFHLAINVLSSEHSNMIRVVPRDDNIEHEVYIGLILQYHYVGLDKLHVATCMKYCHLNKSQTGLGETQ